jgi:hypothetical protein
MARARVSPLVYRCPRNLVIDVGHRQRRPSRDVLV